MPTAQLMWPVEDIDVPTSRAIAAATIDLPRILDENHWTAIGEPTGWRFADGIGPDSEPALYLVCCVDVLEMPETSRRTPGFDQVGCGAA